MTSVVVGLCMFIVQHCSYHVHRVVMTCPHNIKHIRYSTRLDVKSLLANKLANGVWLLLASLRLLIDPRFFPAPVPCGSLKSFHHVAACLLCYCNHRVPASQSCVRPFACTSVILLLHEVAFFSSYRRSLVDATSPPPPFYSRRCVSAAPSVRWRPLQSVVHWARLFIGLSIYIRRQRPAISGRADPAERTETQDRRCSAAEQTERTYREFRSDLDLRSIVDVSWISIPPEVVHRPTTESQKLRHCQILDCASSSSVNFSRISWSVRYILGSDR